MTGAVAVITLAEAAVAILLAPLFIGWIDQCRAWLQNRRGAGLLQPYRTLRKLLHKDAVIAHGASSLFRVSPYVQFGVQDDAWLRFGPGTIDTRVATLQRLGVDVVRYTIDWREVSMVSRMVSASARVILAELIQPSATRATRRSAGPALPPQISGTFTGCGEICSSGNWKCAPS